MEDRAPWTGRERGALFARFAFCAALLPPMVAAQPPRIDVDPLFLDFGATLVGENSAAMEVRVDNRGGLDLFVQSATTTDRAFRQLNPQGFGNFNIGPGQFWTTPIRFRPPRAGVFRADLVVRTNDPDNPVVRVRLEGEGVVNRPNLEVAPTRIDFGPLFVGETEHRTVDLSNSGTAPLTITDISAFPEGFELELNGAAPPLRLEPGDAESFAVSFSPPTVGRFSGAIEVTSNDPNQPLIRVLLTGEGQRRPLDFEVTAFPDALRLEPGRPARLRHQITETAGEQLALTSNQLLLVLADGRTLALPGLPLSATLGPDEMLEIEDTVVLPLELHDLTVDALRGARLQRIWTGRAKGTELSRFAVVDIALTGSLGAEFAVTTVVVDYPFMNTTVAAGDPLRPRILVYGTGSGTALGRVLVDDLVTENFSVDLLSGRPQPVELINSLPTGRVGAHRLAVEITTPDSIGSTVLRSDAVRYLVTARPLDPLRFLDEPGAAIFLREGKRPTWQWTPRAGVHHYTVWLGSRRVATTTDTRWQPETDRWAALPAGRHELRVVAEFDGNRRHRQATDRDDAVLTSFRILEESEPLEVTCSETSCSWSAPPDGEPLHLLVVDHGGAKPYRRWTRASFLDLAELLDALPTSCQVGTCRWRVERLNRIGDSVARSETRPLGAQRGEE